VAWIESEGLRGRWGLKPDPFRQKGTFFAEETVLETGALYHELDESR